MSFKVSIPSGREHRPKNASVLASTPQKIVAIIEDDSRVRRAVARLLSASGFGTETFESAEAFLEVAASSKASCLVVDINLGKMTGIELALQLAERGVKHSIIFMTGRDDDSVRRQAKDVGAVAYLTKPFPARTLIEAINKATSRSPQS
jgi:FixJ family two-component response regulator